MNNKKPLTLDFNTFTTSTSLDYNNGAYVLGRNYSSTEQVNFIQQFITYSLITATKIDIGEIIYSDLVTKILNMSRLRYVLYPRFISCALEVLLGLKYTHDENFGYLPGILMSLLPLSAKKKKEKTQTVTPTLPKSQGPKASGALSKKRKQHKPIKTPSETKYEIAFHTRGKRSTADKGFPFTASHEGTDKTTPCPEGPLGHKDSGGNKPPTDMEPINPTVADPSGTGAKYQVDRTQSTRLRYQSLTKIKGEPSYEGEPDIEALQLKTFADVQALLLSNDEMSPPPYVDKPESFPIQDTDESTSDYSLDHKKFDNILPLTQRHLVKYLKKVSRVLFNRLTEAQLMQHEEAVVSYADLKAAIEGYYEENIDHKEQTDKVIDAAMNSLNKNSIAMGDLLNALNGVTEALKAIQDAVKQDHVLNKKVLKAIEAYTKNFTHLTELLSLVKNFDFQGLKSSVKSLQATALTQEEHLASWAKSSTSMAWNLGPRMTAVESSQDKIRSEISSLKKDTLDIKSMMTEIYQSFKEGKAIVTDDQPEDQRKFMPVSKEVRPDPDAPILVPYEINGKIFQLTNEQIQAHLDKEEKIKKADEKPKLFEMTKTKVIKKAKRAMELRMKWVEQYMWTMSKRLKPEPITDVKIHPNTKPAVLTVYRNNDKRNFEVYNLFKFRDFRITKLDELGPIIKNKKNSIVKDLMTSLGKRYERLKKIPKELGIQSALPALVPGQVASQSSGRKRKHMELEPEIKVLGLECNRSLPDGV
ncbi:hypothetical protein Tco_0221398 [Tanacetum coccineum]